MGCEVLLPFEEGGLNLDAIKCKILALIGKWWSRFRTESASLWVRVIQRTSLNIRCELLEQFVQVDWNEVDTNFWNDNWLSDEPLKVKFSRLYRLETDQEVKVGDRVGWNEQCYEGINWVETSRNNLIPKKVEAFVCGGRKKKRLPVLTELDKHGIDLNSVRCPICEEDIESVEHSLLFCKLAFDIWSKVSEWWGFGGSVSLSIGEIFDGSSTCPMTDLGAKIWQAINWTCAYLI
ncbi:uncharacterized protein [Rutidosis leptorrhynchoides]|uniref:uncharacterized protein n=1 Tax=Rutidosis leptorrhynchoides TaxID=125765 RepID=UPI003A99CC1B